MGDSSLFPLQEAGLKEGDYIILVNGKDCRWSKHAEVVQLLKSTGEEGGVYTRLDEEEADDFLFATAALTTFFAATALVWRADAS